jgi:glucosamine--fructose-6-phosphate aminotransferase (isomerizing)
VGALAADHARPDLTLQTRSRLQQEIEQQALVLRTVLTRQVDILDQARSAVAASSRTFLVGIGSSRHVAAYGAACLDALTAVPATLLPSPGAAVPLPRLGSGDIVVVVSQSGRTPALTPLLQAVRDAGALLVSVTNAPGSPLERAADLALVTGAGQESVVPATKSVTASMLLLRALAAPVSTAAVGLLADAVDQIVARRWDADLVLPQVVVAGGFAAEAVSDEVALKLAEVCGVLVVAETVVDYLHGPAVVPAPVLAFLDSDDPNAAAFDDRPDVLRIDSGCGDPTLDAIVRIVAGQCLAVRWAQDAGLDPDDPRGLDKVTHSL